MLLAQRHHHQQQQSMHYRLHPLRQGLTMMCQQRLVEQQALPPLNQQLILVQQRRLGQRLVPVLLLALEQLPALALLLRPVQLLVRRLGLVLEQQLEPVLARLLRLELRLGMLLGLVLLAPLLRLVLEMRFALEQRFCQ